MSGDVLDAVRARSAQVIEQATHVRVDTTRLEKLGLELAADPPPPAQPDPAHHLLDDATSTLAYVLTLDAVNFGSGWFPLLRKRPGLSGYFTLATSLREHFAARGPWSAGELQGLDAGECARVFGQVGSDPAVRELMELFARALRDLGDWLQRRFDGHFEGPVEAAGGFAARLVALLAEMPLYRDVARYRGLEVPFYKRAQLSAADLCIAFEGRGPGCFEDLERLTCFADNLVPHVLRCEGVLCYTPELAGRIDAAQLIEAGSPEEVEIRAAAVTVVERLAQQLRRGAAGPRPFEIDGILWNRGQRPEIKANPRHRTRTPFY